MNSNSHFKTFRLLPILLIWFFACTPQAAGPLQNPQQFAEVYAKLLIAIEVDADSSVLARQDKNLKRAYADSILQSQGVPRQEFEMALKYYSAHPEQWQKIYARVIEILEEQNSAADSTKK